MVHPLSFIIRDICRMMSLRYYLIPICIGIVCAMSAALWRIIEHAPLDITPLAYLQSHYPTTVLDCKGKVLMQFCLQHYEPLDISEVPSHVIQAFLAAEDRHFFNHHGLSIGGIIRSFWKNIRSGRPVQGGSTITQQLVKLAYLNNSKHYTRKLKEAWITWQLERHLCKEQILQAYLNHIYVGMGVYGLKAAARHYCGVDVSELSIEQAALLAGLVQSPERLNPFKYPQHARARRNIVLQRMAACGFISDHTSGALASLPLLLHQDTASIHLSCALQESLRSWLLTIADKDMLYRTGLVVQTTLDQQLMHQVQDIMNMTCRTLDSRQKASIDGGLILLEGATGAIRAIVTGKDMKSHFDRARQARRQLGSLIKPLVYYAALCKGASLADILIDEPICLPVGDQLWSPGNYHGKFVGPVSRAYALTRSLNTCAVQTLLTAGIDTVVQLATACHLAPVIAPYPSLALGCIDVTVHDATAYFNMFAQQGTYHKPWYVAWVKQVDGTILYRHQLESSQLLRWPEVSQITYTLAQGCERYKATLGAFFPHAQVIAKTGTTNGASSCWCGAATPELTCVAYLGRDDNKPLERLFSYRSTLPLVLSCLQVAENNGYEPTRETFAWHPSLQITTFSEPAQPDEQTSVLMPKK